MTESVPERRLFATLSSDNARLSCRSCEYCSSMLWSATKTRGARRPKMRGGVTEPARTKTGIKEPSLSLSISSFSEPSVSNGRRCSVARSKADEYRTSLTSPPMTSARSSHIKPSKRLFTCRIVPSSSQMMTASLVISTSWATSAHSLRSSVSIVDPTVYR